MERFGPENYLRSTEKVDERWQEQRRRDLDFTIAWLDLAEKFPQLLELLPSLFHSLPTYGRKELNKTLPPQQADQPKK